MGGNTKNNSNDSFFIKDLSDREREDLIEECVFYGLEKLSEVLKSQSGKAVTSREDDLYEKNTMLNIQVIFVLFCLFFCFFFFFFFAFL